MTEHDVPSGRPAAVATPARGDPRLARLSLNQATVTRAPLPRAVEACAAAGVPAIGLWREHVADTGLARAARLVRDAGLRVSSLCRGGFLTSADPGARRSALEDNRRAVDEAAALGTGTLVLVVGGLPGEGDRDLVAARERVRTAVAELAPYAGSAGVRLALEPLHPVYCADRAVLSTLAQALDIAEEHPVSQVGVVVDAFHLWWDPQLAVQLRRAAGRIASFQVADWVTPLPPDVLLARGMMGDGHVDLAGMLRAVDATGYDGDVEVEIFNADVWDADVDDVVATVTRRYVEHVLSA